VTGEQSPAGVISQIHQTPGTGGNFAPPAPPAPPAGLFSQIHQAPSKVTEQPAFNQNAGTGAQDGRQTEAPSGLPKNGLPSARSAWMDAGPPGAHFAPSQDDSPPLPEGGSSKHGDDDNTRPDSEFLRMFPGARM
jgi:hypothetical protein